MGSSLVHLCISIHIFIENMISLSGWFSVYLILFPRNANPVQSRRFLAASVGWCISLLCYGSLPKTPRFLAATKHISSDWLHIKQVLRNWGGLIWIIKSYCFVLMFKEVMLSLKSFMPQWIFFEALLEMGFCGLNPNKADLTLPFSLMWKL